MLHLWGCPLEFQTVFYLAINLSCLDRSPAGKLVRTVMRFPEALGSGVGEGYSKAVDDPKSGSVGPNSLFVGHLFTSMLPL